MPLKISNFSLGIGVPNTWTHVYSAFFDSFIQLERPDFKYLPAKNGPIDQLRNRIVEQALMQGCSHLWMIDTDQEYPKDALTKMLSHNLPVVHALVPRRYPPFDNLMMKGELNHFTSAGGYTDGSLVEVDACGTGCVLYNVQVFKKIRPPWFEFKANPDKEKGGVVGEDIGFCLKLKKAGYKIYVDTSVKVKHLTTFSVDEAFSTLYQSLIRRQMEIDKKAESSSFEMPARM